MSAEFETELTCLHCDRETSHEMLYRGKYIHRIKCLDCGTEIAVNSGRILEKYTSESLEKIFASPNIINEEIRKELARYITSLPVRIVTKPARMAREFLDIFKEEK